MASILDISEFNKKRNKKMLPKHRYKKSLFISLRRKGKVGNLKYTKPKTMLKLNMLEPITFPKAWLGYSLKADSPETNSSGVEVPIPSNRLPIISGLSRKCSAKSKDLFNNRLDPTTKPPRPKDNKII